MTVITVALGLASGLSALRSQTLVFPALFLDPFRCYSAVSVPSWPGSPHHLRFPDRLVAIDGVSLHPEGREGYRSDVVQSELRARVRQGRSEVSLRFLRGDTELVTRRPLLHIGQREIAWFWVPYVLLGILIVWSGMVVVALSSRLLAARAYAVWSIAVYVFLVTFFDYHSLHLLAPFFSLATYAVGCGFILLALYFPEPPGFSVQTTRGLTIAACASSAALGLATATLPLLGVESISLRLIGSVWAPIAALVLVVSIVVRYRRSAGAQRSQLRATLLGMLLVPILVFVGVTQAMLTGTSVVHMLLPMALPLVPLSIGYSLIRHNLLGTTAVLSQRLLVVPNVSVAALLSTVLWLALRSASPYTTMDLALPTFLSGGFFVALVVLGHRALSRWLFPATEHFRPTLQQIADRLATLEHHDAVTEALKNAIRHWLPTDTVRVLAPDALGELEGLPPDTNARLRQGGAVWTEDDPWNRHLLVPMRSLGALRGVLVLAPKHQGALYTSEDLALLETIASLGAVALHNAEILTELDARRRLEVEVGREDKRATLGTLSAQLAHEISHPLTLFRGMLRRAGRGQLSERDVEVGGDEIERLERLLAAMRRLELPQQRQEPVTLRDPVERVILLLDELMRVKEVTASVEVPESLVVIGDRDALVQIFSNLLRNGVQAAPRGGHVGVSVRTTPQLVIDVWDDGPGVPEAMVHKLFVRWVTNKEGGTGLGLAVTEDLVRKLQWKIHYLREGGRSVFRLQPRTSERPTEPPEADDSTPMVQPE